MNAQLGFCGGNSGDPIFTEDFGTGLANNSLPAGTTTYPYSNGFPNDGFYTVANGSVGNGFDWHQIQDHTIGDVNGKFLMVNAGVTAGEFYRTTVSGLCETTTYEFSSWIINLVIAGSFCSTQPGGTIPINVRFEIWDSTDTNLLASGNTGNIVETNSPNWQEYGLVFQTLTGQNAVILKMINNGQGGCGNDLAIDDLEFKSCGDTITVTDTSNNNSESLCSGETPYNTTLTATPDNAVFTNHFYQWQESADGVTWTDIAGETNQNLVISGLTITRYYRAKVAEYAANLSNVDCITFSDVYQVIVTQATSPPTIECWESATLDNATCSWVVTGTQPNAPTGLECWETAAFNDATCSWDVTGTQPTAPTGLDCWETTTFNTTTCNWDISGTQPAGPTGLECWETATFNDATCSWDVTGTQPTEPTGLECWETTTFNTTTCNWDISGTQPVQPNLECWETATFNDATCSWDVTGTQPTEPTGLECWETTTFNTTTCSWEVTGTQPVQPDIECWETTTYNDATCSWDVTGTQPTEPTGLECWETTTFNTTTCNWDISGTQPVQPDLECWETATFNNSSCNWEIEGTEPLESIEENIAYCEGDDVILTGDVGLQNAEYEWSTGAISQDITIDQPGTYSVIITSDNCYTVVKTIYVSQNSSPIIESVSSDGNNIVLITSNSGDFEYSLDGINFQLSNIFYNAPGGFYTVFVSERNGCGISTTAYLHFVIPKFFTPNGDNYNDTFDLKGIELYESSEVAIYDRYGKLLKSAKNQAFSWDGTFIDANLPTTDYWYIITIEGQKFSGHFTLKR